MNWMKKIDWITILTSVGSLLASTYLQYIFPIQNFLIGIFILVMLDLYTGIKAAKKREEVINSKGLRKSVIKIRDYFIAILAANTLQEIWLAALPVVYTVSLYIAIVEFRSNLENISILTDTNLVEKVFERLKLKK